jgi:hypothetical protein
MELFRRATLHGRGEVGNLRLFLKGRKVKEKTGQAQHKDDRKGEGSLRAHGGSPSIIL